MVAPAQTKLGRYTLLELLGTGGMAEVWRARLDGPAGFNRELVIKRILPHLARDEKLVQLFLNEARVSSRLQHPNIVPVFELGQEGGWFFLSMEHLRGCDVLRVMQGHFDPVTAPGLAAYTIAEVCRALAYAHAYVNAAEGLRGIIHRDVSPSNIMLTDAGHVKLLDFGIAKVQALTENLTEPGTLKGKIGYVSPQQADGEPIDHRADLFSAGVVLHEMLTGKRLFRGDDAATTLALVREAKAPPPSSINPHVSARLDEICARALARSADARFQHASEMADALDEEVQRIGWDAAQTARLVAPVIEAQAQKRSVAGAEIGATASLPGDSTTPEHRRPVHPPDASKTSPGLRNALVAAALVGLVIIGVGWKLRRDAAPVVAPVVTSPVAASPVEPPPHELEAPPTVALEPTIAAPSKKVPAVVSRPKHHQAPNAHRRRVDFESARLPD